MKSFVINFTGDNAATNELDEPTILDACTIKGEVATDAVRIGNRSLTYVLLEISSLSPDGEPTVWGSEPSLEMNCEATTLEDGRHVVAIWLSAGEG